MQEDGAMIEDLGSCPRCNRPLEATNWFWHNGQTEAGTDFFEVAICCVCGWSCEGTEWGGADTEDEAVEKTQDVIDARSDDKCR